MILNMKERIKLVHSVTFFKSNIHVLLTNSSLVFQQAANQPTFTLPSKIANNNWQSSIEKRSWLEWVNKPQEKDSCKMTFSGFSDAITASAISADEKLIACASQDCVIKIYNAETSSEICTLVGHSNLITCLKFSPDCSQLASSSWDESIIIWDVKSEFVISILSGHERKVNSIEYNQEGNYLASASWDTTIKIWDCSNEFKCRYTINTGERPVNCVTWSCDEKRVIAGLWDGTIKVFDIEDPIVMGKEGVLVATLEGHTKSIQSIAVSPLGKHMASGSMDQTLLFWDAVSNKLISPLSQHSKPVTAVAFTKDGSHLLSASADSTVKVWMANLGTQLENYPAPSGSYMASCAFHPRDSSILATGSSECTVITWDLSTFEPLETMYGHTRPITCLEYSPNGEYIASASEDSFYVWEAHTGKEAFSFAKEGNKINVNGLSWSPDGTRLATCSDDCMIRIWDMTSTKNVKAALTLKGHDSAVRSVQFDSQGVTLCSAGRDNTVRLWDSRSGNLLSTMKGHRDWITSCAFNPAGNRIASCGWDMTVRIWNTRSPEQAKLILEGHSNAVSYVRFSTDGKTLITCSFDGTLKIWDAETGTEVTTLIGHKAGVHSFAINATDGTIASVSDDSTIKIWDPLRATEVRTLVGHADSIKAATFSAETKMVITGSLDKTMKVWDAGLVQKDQSRSSSSFGSLSSTTNDMDVDTTHRKGGLKGHTATINSISLSSQSIALLTCSDDRTCRLWDLQTFHCLRKIEGPNKEIFKSGQFIEGYQSFVTAGDDGTVAIWDTRSGHLSQTVAKHAGPATCVSVQGNKIISGGWNNMLVLSDLRKTITQYGGHSDWILGCAISKDGNAFASAGWDRDILLWTGTYDNYSTKLSGHTDTITSIDISPDARFLASASYDSTIKIWSLATKSLVTSYANHKGKVNQLAYTKQDNLLLSAGNDMAVKLWDVNSGKLRGEFFCHGPATSVNSAVISNELVMAFGDSIGNIYLSKLHPPRF